MSGPVLVLDAGGTPLMPMSAAYARKLLHERKAQRLPHSAFTVIQLSRQIAQPSLRPLVATLRIHLRTAELTLVAEVQQVPHILAHIIIDLRTDLPRRLRRRAGHRRRRRSRQRYHARSRQGRPHKLRRPSFARSTWGSALLRSRPRRVQSAPHSKRGTPLFQWRAQAITRTVRALQTFVPISHVVLLDQLDHVHHEYRPPTPAQRREQLIRAYNARDTHGLLLATCAFCRSTEGQIEVEHLLPCSRGGSDAWENLALACRDCNQRKATRTPTEAGMPLLLHHHLQSIVRGRRRPYIDATLRLLPGHIRRAGCTVVSGYRSGKDEQLPQHLIDAARSFEENSVHQSIIAYPVSRPRKQRFSAHNYPLNTPLRADLVRVGQSIRRLIRVNEGLQVQRVNGRITTTVMPLGTVPSQSSDARSVIIRPGMLCAASRAGELVVGIVSAIHSSGRLSLRVLESADLDGVNWRSVVVSPRRGITVISTGGVVFVRVLAIAERPIRR